MAVNKGAQTGFVGVQRRRLQQLAQFVHRNALIHLVQPGFHLVEQFQVRLFRQIPLFLREGNLDFELLPERKIDWENRAILSPLRLARVRDPRRGWGIER